MKPHHILVDFRGSQTGIDVQQFKAGTTELISDYLAETTVRAGQTKPVEKAKPAKPTIATPIVEAEQRETQTIAEAPEKKPLLEKITGKKPKKNAA